MKGFIERLEIECKEIEERTLKLQKFIDSTDILELEPIHQHLLVAQIGAMTSYYSIVELRTKLLKEKANG
jgi:hypothetical protein